MVARLSTSEDWSAGPVNLTRSLLSTAYKSADRQQCQAGNNSKRGNYLGPEVNRGEDSTSERM